MSSSESSSRPLGVVTGASSGIGLELAKEFARNGFDLLVAAEDEGLADAASELRGMGAEVTECRTDLATHDGVETFVQAVQATGRPVDALALNAGVGLAGQFVETEVEEHLRLISLNVTSTVHAAGHLLPAMRERGSGRVLITSSIASQMPGPYQSTYNASKAFLQSFSNALHSELQGTGVTVTALMPGPTDTNFFDRAGNEDTKLAEKRDSAAQVAAQGYEAMMAGEAMALGGSLASKVQGAVGRFVPEGVKAELHKRMAKPGSGSGSE